MVVHGPEVIDSGVARQLLDRTEEEAEKSRPRWEAPWAWRRCSMPVWRAGYQSFPGSWSPTRCSGMDRACDVVVLLNRAKSRESGLGLRTAWWWGRYLRKLTRPLVQLDRRVLSSWKDGPSGPRPERHHRGPWTGASRPLRAGTRR